MAIRANCQILAIFWRLEQSVIMWNIVLIIQNNHLIHSKIMLS